MKPLWLHCINVSVLYYRWQAGNLKFIRDTSQSQDIKFGLSYRHEPQNAMSYSFRECNIHDSGREILELSVSSLWICAQQELKWDKTAVSSVRKAIQMKTDIEENFGMPKVFLIIVCSYDSFFVFVFVWFCSIGKTKWNYRNYREEPLKCLSSWLRKSNKIFWNFNLPRGRLENDMVGFTKSINGTVS